MEQVQKRKDASFRRVNRIARSLPDRGSDSTTPSGRPAAGGASEERTAAPPAPARRSTASTADRT